MVYSLDYYMAQFSERNKKYLECKIKLLIILNSFKVTEQIRFPFILKQLFSCGTALYTNMAAKLNF